MMTFAASHAGHAEAGPVRVFQVFRSSHVLEIRDGIVVLIAIDMIDFVSVRKRADKGRGGESMNKHVSHTPIAPQLDTGIAAPSDSSQNAAYKSSSTSPISGFGCPAHPTHASEVADFVEALESFDHCVRFERPLLSLHLAPPR